MSSVQGLVTALAAKVGETQVLMNVPSRATIDYPDIWTNAGSICSSLLRLHFSNFAASSINLSVGTERYGAFTTKATPPLADISDSTVAAQNVSFSKPLTHILELDLRLGTEAPLRYVVTSTTTH